MTLAVLGQVPRRDVSEVLRQGVAHDLGRVAVERATQHAKEARLGHEHELCEPVLGGGGGASLGLLIELPASGVGPSFRRLHVITGSGGDGGAGGVGMGGGQGGIGAPGGDSDFWCARSGGQGGGGGRGGAGGGGSGGCGGSSVGIYVSNALQSTAYAQTLAANATIELAGSGGDGGPAGFAPVHAGSQGSDAVGSAILVAP